MIKPRMTVVQMRTSLLLPHSIRFSDENGARYSKLLENSKLKKEVDSDEEWGFTNDKTEFMFLPSRVNVMSHQNMEEETQVNSFIKEVIRIFSEIINYEGIGARVISYSPILAFDNSDDFSNEIFFGTLLKVNTVSGVKPSTTSFQAAYHIEREIPSGKCEVNHIINFSEGVKITRSDHDEIKTDCLMAEMELNVPLKKEGYQVKDIESFFIQAGVWKQELLDTYFDAL